MDGANEEKNIQTEFKPELDSITFYEQLGQEVDNQTAKAKHILNDILHLRVKLSTLYAEFSSMHGTLERQLLTLKEQADEKEDGKEAPR